MQNVSKLLAAERKQRSFFAKNVLHFRKCILVSEVKILKVALSVNFMTSCNFIFVFTDLSSFVNWNTLGDEELPVSLQSQQSVALKSESKMTVS